MDELDISGEVVPLLVEGWSGWAGTSQRRSTGLYSGALIEG